MKFKVLLNLSMVLLMLGMMSSSAFALISPPTMTYPTDTQTNLLFNVQLAWNSVPTASYYALQVSTTNSFTNPNDQVINLAKVEDVKYALSGITYNKDYYWRLRSVIAKDGVYEESAWSTAFKFSTIPAINIVGQTEVCNAIDNVKAYVTDAIPGVVYTWTVTGGTIISDGNATDNKIDVQWTTGGAQSVKVVRTATAWGSFTDNGTLAVTVDAIKTFVITTATDTYYDGKYCPNERIKFTATITDPNYDESDFAEYYWEFDGVRVSNVMSTNYVWSTLGTHHVKFFARTIASECANYTNEFDIMIVNTCPVTALLDSDNNICTGAPIATFVTYVFGGAGGSLATDYTYKWSPAASFLNATVKDGDYKETTKSKYVDFYATDKAGQIGRLNFKVLLKARPVPSIVNVLTVPNSVNNLDFEYGDAEGNYKLLLDYGCYGFCDGWSWTWMDKNYNPGVDQNDVDILPGLNTYYLVVTNDQDCDSKLYRGVVYRARSKEIMEHEYTVGVNSSSVMFAYPNPVVNSLNVFAEFDKDANMTCSIINLEGKVVKTFNSIFGKIYDANLDVSELPVGSYILSVETPNDATSWKFNKN